MKSMRLDLVGFIVVVAGCLGLSANPAGGAGFDLDFTPVQYDLTTTSASFQLSRGAPQIDVSMYFSLRFSQPGKIFDTVGIESASVGAWSLELQPDLRLRFSIFAPGASSPFAEASGWHRFSTQEALTAGVEYWIFLDIINDEMLLLVTDNFNNQYYVFEHLPCKLANQPVYVGDYPGDNYLGEAYSIHSAFIGELEAYYFGPYTEVMDGPQLSESLIIGQAGGAKPVSGGVVGNADPQSNTPAGTPAAAVKAFLDAQASEDLELMMSYAACDSFSQKAEQAMRSVLQLISNKTSLTDVHFEERGTAYSKQGNYALVRCVHGGTIRTATETESALFGSMVLVKKYSDCWKVAHFFTDDLLNAELDYASRPAARRPSGLILASMQQAPAPQAQLLNEVELSRMLSAKLEQYYFDETKTAQSEFISLVGLFPFGGDIIAAVYTASEIVETVYKDLIPSITAGDRTMFVVATAQVGCGIFQIAMECTPGMDVLSDQWGVTLDNIKHNIRQGRAISSLRFKISVMDSEAPIKYLFLRPQAIYNDPQRGIKGIGNLPNVEFVSYDDLRFQPAPLKKIKINSDVPARFWRTLDFDIGFYYTIKESDSELMFKLARDAGYPVHSIPGITADNEVYIPVRMKTVTEKGPLVAGELSYSELQQDPAHQAVPVIESRGTPVLQRGRIVSGKGLERYLSFEITPTPGPNQTLQIQLDDAKGRLTRAVEIENAVYNAVEVVVPAANLNQRDEKERYLATVPMGTTTEMLVLGDTTGYPQPVIIGAPDSAWAVDDETIAKLSVSGKFPDAKLLIEGLKPGIAAVNYRLLVAKRGPDGIAGSELVDRVFYLKVANADWVLTDTQVELSTPQHKTEHNIVAGSAVAKRDWSGSFSGNPEAWVAGKVIWSSPPKSIPDKGGIWQLDGSVERTCQNPSGGGYSMIEMESTSVNLMFTDQWSFSSMPVSIGGLEWKATSASPRVQVKQEVNLDTCCVREKDRSGMSYTGRRVIYVVVILPGVNAHFKYIYEPTGKPGSK